MAFLLSRTGFLLLGSALKRLERSKKNELAPKKQHQQGRSSAL
jgi:hypothetical protein